MILANCLSIESPQLVNFRHPPIEKNNVGNLLDGIVATRIENSNGIWRRTDKDNRMVHTHNVETMSKTKAYRNHINNSVIETSKVFEREMPNERIENIVIRLDKTRLDNNKMTRSTDSLKHSETYELESNSDPEPSSSNSSESWSLDSKAKKKKRKKKKTRRKHWKDDSSDPYLSDDYDSSNDSHYRRKQRKHKNNRENYPIRLCSNLTANLMTTSNNSNIFRFKMNEDTLQRRIYFLTFIDSLDMIFHSTEKLVKFFQIILK